MDPSCETKPICPWADREWARVAGAEGPCPGATVRNEPNLAPDGREGPWLDPIEQDSGASQILDGSGTNDYCAGLSDVLWRWEAARLEPE